MNKNIFVHVGYPKSASTTLQKTLFSKHSDILNLGLYPTNNIGVDTKETSEDSIYLNDGYLKIFYDNMTKLNEKEYAKSNNEFLFNEKIKKYILATDKKVIFSHERFTSVFFAYKDYQVKAKRLYNFFPNAKILFIIRNQYNWLMSQYRDHPFDPRNLSSGKATTFDEWFEIASTDKSIKLMDNLDYYNVIQYYEDLYGRQNIGVFQFEELITDLESFSQKISDFLEINKDKTQEILSGQHENKGVSNIYNYYRQFKRSYLKNLSKKKYFPVLIEKKIEDLFKNTKYRKRYKLSLENIKILEDYYADNNLKLSQKYNLKYTYIGKNNHD